MNEYGGWVMLALLREITWELADRSEAELGNGLD